jgi:hypothetical protein
VTATRITAAEEIQAAMVELNASRQHLVACPEFQYSAVRHVARNCDMEHECKNEGENCGWQYETAAAFDMLTRTIDAQLKILETTIQDEHADWLTELEWQNALALARAINGAEQL